MISCAVWSMFGSFSLVPGCLGEEDEDEGDEDDDDDDEDEDEEEEDPETCNC
jgi:hypothetical protein